MFSTILAIGAGILIGNKQARDKAGEMLKETFGNITNSLIKKEVTNETTNKVISTTGDETSTPSL